MARGCYPDDVRVGGMHDDARDVLRIFESNVLPRLRAVGGFVEAVAVIGAAREGVVTRSDPDDIRVRGRDSNCADGVEANRIGDVLERGSRIDGFPDTAGAGGGVEGVGVGLIGMLGY